MYQKEKPSHCVCLWSRLVAVDALVLLHPAPPLRLDVFGSQPAIPGQRGLSQAQRQQPAGRHTQLRHTHWHTKLASITGKKHAFKPEGCDQCYFQNMKRKYKVEVDYINLITTYLATTSILWRSSAVMLCGSSFLISTKSSSTDWGHKTKDNFFYTALFTLKMVSKCLTETQSLTPEQEKLPFLKKETLSRTWFIKYHTRIINKQPPHSPSSLHQRCCSPAAEPPSGRLWTCSAVMRTVGACGYCWGTPPGGSERPEAAGVSDSQTVERQSGSEILTQSTTSVVLHFNL